MGMAQSPASWPPLPIDKVLPELLQTLADANTAILVADPGAGKTTRVPLALIDAPWRSNGRIIVLEPRRLAARGAAAQMARLLCEEVGDTVGYRVRLEAKVSRRTLVEVVTEGVFTRMVVEDPELTGVAAVLFDEFHERSLDADLGLAFARDVQLALRPDLRILVMSATLDAARVSDVLGHAPVVRSEGRAFPVETRYAGRDRALRIEDDVARVVRRAMERDQGSVLAFLPGAGEIERCARTLSASMPADVEVAPLYGALDIAAQDKAIRPAPQGQRKIVLATSIAETSLTIEGISIVVDSGLARVPKFEPASGLTRLETVRVSRAAADQRRGRAGRLGPGTCWRLWDEPETRALPAFATPEILEADLAPLLLDAALFGVTDPATLSFLDPPPAPALSEARALLLALQAIGADGRLTEEGRRLARLPLAPRLGHMLLQAAASGETLQAADMAVLLQERGLGGTDTDIAHRLTRFRSETGKRAEDARRLAQRWATLAGGAPSRQNAARTGVILASAYPDRVARARPGKPGEYLLINGRGAFLDPADGLAKSTWLAVADLQGGDSRARILSAASISESEVLSRFRPDIRETDEHEFDGASQSVRARRRTRLGAIFLSEQPMAADPLAAAPVLTEAIHSLGLDRLPWSKSAAQLRQRMGFLAKADPAGWPETGAEHLSVSVEDWLLPYAPGATRFSDLGPALHDALLGLLDASQRAKLDTQAPTHFEAPTGTRVAVDYEAEAGPTIAIRVQELFGLTRHPALAGGRVPLVLELLSPAHRPIQVTRDLPGFWKGSWAGVRSDMRGRYPRHPWPEDPAVAPPTTRVKPRGT
jgi:ATP-dependent helicase HrpB